MTETKHHLIGLTGPKGSGKTAVAKYLEAAYFFHRDAFAAPIKDMAATGLGFTQAQLYGAEKETPLEVLDGHTPREAFLAIGEGLRNSLGPNIWVDLLFRRIERLGATTPRVVIEDVRMPHEAEAIRRRGGQILYILRPGIEVTDHYTEKSIGLGDADHIFRNNATIAEVCNLIMTVLNGVKR
jgi:hypothetical protein